MIGFTGPYSDVNFGDYAMLVNNVYKLEPRDAVVFIYDRPFMEKIRADYFGGRSIRFVEVELRAGAFANGRDTRHLTPLEILGEIANLEELTAAVTGMETLYVNGGGYFNSLWTMPHRVERFAQIIAPLIIAATQNVPVVFTANGFGPFRGDTEFFAALFGSMPNARFGARDTILSPYWLAQTGVDRALVHTLPDDLLFIDERLAPVGDSRDDRYIVMETYLPVDFIADHVEPFESFARRLAQDHGLRIVFLPFNLGHGGIDQGRFLADTVTGIELFDIANRGYLPIGDAVELIRGAELVISSRYHAVILALATGTPFVSVLKDVLGDKQYYYGKNVGALKGILGEQPYDLRDYFHTDYVEAMAAVADDFTGITQRQREAHRAAFPTTSPQLRAARDAYLTGGNR